MTTFGGTKTLVFSTTNALGGQNYFLSYSYAGVGVLSLLFSAVFAVIHKRTSVETGSVLEI